MQQRYSIPLEQIIESELLAIPSETSMEEVVQTMSNWTNSCLLTVKNRINVCDLLSPVCHSCIIAIANSQVEGILTERALVRLIATERNIKDLTLAEVMNRNVITITASGSQDIFTALNLFRRYQIDRVPIVDERKKLLGLVTHDSLRHILRSADLLKQRTVREVMSRAIHALTAASALDVARLMSDYQVNIVPIVEQKAEALIPLGIITAIDIVRFQSLELNLNEVRAGEVISTPLFFAQPEESLWEVRQQMDRNCLQRLVVVDERGELLGIIAQGDLLRAVDTQQLQCSLIMQNSVRLEQTKIEALEKRNAQLCARLERQAKREQLVAQTALRIGQSLDLDSILQATVTEVRQLIESDRVLIYRFESDGSGIVSTEAVSHPQWSIANRVVRDACFEQAMIAPYQQGHIFKAADIERANLSPCHVEFLKSFQVKANVAIPILLSETNGIKERLWGLLIVHQCSATRNWQASELELLQLLTSQLAIAIQQGELYQQVQIELEQRRRAETAIRERETQLRTALDAAAMGTWIWNITTDEVILSERSQSILGFNPDDTCTLDAIRERIHPQDLPQINERSKQAITSGGLYEIETRIILADGKQRWLTARGHVLLNSTGLSMRMVGVVADITEKKLLEEQSSRHQRLENIGSLAGGVAHDLNNIFTPIMMSVQLLPVTLAQIDPRSRELIQMLENNVKRGSALVQQVLSFAKGIEGKRGIVQVKHLIEDIRQIAKETFPKSIQIKSDIASNLWAVKGDATKIHQILLNLAINARDAMPDGGILNFSVANLSVDPEYVRNRPQAKVGAYIVISIADTGIGIPPSNLEQIFEPFFTTKATKGGTGLGLATVNNVVREHDGFIDVISQTGEGTQFNVFIPATEVVKAESNESLAIPRGKGELILVADDEATIREITKASLETHNYRVLTASNGIEAVAAYVREQSEIAVVLMNMLMPDMDGATAIRTLQTINPDVKILAVSGHNFSSKSFSDRNLKIEGFLAKPYTTQALLQKIGKVVSG